MRDRTSGIAVTVILGLATGLLSCGASRGSPPANMRVEPEFTAYWMAGKAEISRYELKQARYGELRKGDAVLIFVTEEFLPVEQVKYEHGDRPDRVPILKLNATRNFLTGIYPYSVMTSSFTPLVRPEEPFKITFSAQEWCGHVFMQWNRRENGYAALLRSYFQDEADQETFIDGTLYEDNLWSQIRVNPASIPAGRVRLVPAVHFLRFGHHKAEAVEAVLSTRDVGARSVLRVEYPTLVRTLEIEYETAFPRAILGWRDRYKDGWGEGARELVTEGRRTHVLLDDYWKHNRNEDLPLRKRLGL